MLDAAELPDDTAALKARPIAADVRDQRKNERIAHLEKLVAGAHPVLTGQPA